MEDAAKETDRVIRRVSSRSRRIAIRARRKTEGSTSDSDHDEDSPKLGRKGEHKMPSVKTSQQKLAIYGPRIDINPQDNFKIITTILGICQLNISFFHIWLAASIYNLQKSFSMLAQTVRELPQPQRKLDFLSKAVENNTEGGKEISLNPSNQFARSSKQTSEGGCKQLPKTHCSADDLNTGDSEDPDYVSDHSMYSRPHKSVTELDISMDESLAESSGHESGYLSSVDLSSFLNRGSSSTASPAVSPQSITLAYHCGRPTESFHLRPLKHGAVAEIIAKIPTPAITLPKQPSVKGSTITETASATGSSVEELLKSSVIETKYVTAIFEMTVGGIDELLGDVLNEMKMWFDGSLGLMCVACEVQWSVPEKYRNHSLEMR